MVNRPEAWFDAAKASYELIYRWRSDEFYLRDLRLYRIFNENRAALVVNGPWFLGEIAEASRLAWLHQLSHDRAGHAFLTSEGFLSPRIVRLGRTRALAKFLAGEERLSFARSSPCVRIETHGNSVRCWQ